MQLQTLLSSVQNSINDLLPITSTESTDLQANYNTQITKIQAAISGANTTDSTALGIQLQDLRSQIQIYDSRRDTIIGNYVGESKDFFSAVKTEFKYYCTMMIYILGPLFGFIIATNTFYAEKVSIKLFYGFWGALWYPLTLLFGVIDPPKWRALIIPLVATNESFFFLQFWMYKSVTDIAVEIEDSAKSKTMMRMICLALFAAFFYSFFT